MKYEVTGNLCGIHANDLNWPKHHLGWAKSECWACGRKTTTYVVGSEEPSSADKYGKLTFDKGKAYFELDEKLQPTVAINHNSANVKNIFIVGCQRSGTTLLGLMLGSHPDITLYDEPESYAFESCMCNNKCGCCNWVKNDEVTRPEADSPYSVYKVPMWTHRIDSIYDRYPNSKFIFLSRNPVAVVSSMKSLRMSSGTWIEEQAKGEIAAMLSKLIELDPPMGMKLMKQFRYIATEKGQIEIGTFCWYLKELFYGYFKPLPIFYVFYENLVENSYETTQQIFNFFDIPWNPGVMKHHLIQEGIKIGKTDGSRSVDTDSIEKYKQTLTEEEISRIKDLLQHLGTI